MKRRLLVLDAARQSYRLETLHVEGLSHDEREAYLTLHGESLCQYLLRRGTTSGQATVSAQESSRSRSMIIARGPLPFLAGNKATVGYVSPLTGVPHYSFVGGRAAAQLFHLGLDAIVLTGESRQDHYVLVSGSAPNLRVQFKPADALPGGQRAAFYYLVKEELDGNPGAGSVFVLGEGAQHGYLTANLAVEAVYHAGRGGAGSVFSLFARGLVLRGDPVDQIRYLARAGADPAFARNPNGRISPRLSDYTSRLAGAAGGTIVKLSATGGSRRGQRTLPSRNAAQMGYELSSLGDRRVLAATRDGHTGCHWCPVDCSHWHWVEADYAPGGRDKFLDDFEPTYAVFSMLGLLPADGSFQAQLELLQDVNRRLILPIEQMGCDIMDVGIGLAALFEGLERGVIPKGDVPPDLGDAHLGSLDAAVLAVSHLRQGVDATRYPALRAIGDGPQALAKRYPGMQELVYTGGRGTMGNAGHSNALWTFLMPFSRFFSHYSGQIYKIDEAMPEEPGGQALRAVFARVIARMLDRECFGILCNALSCCAFTFVVFSQDGQGGCLDDEDLLVSVLSEYGIHVTRDDLIWFAQAFWAQSVDLKARYGWRPPAAADMPYRIFEGLQPVLGRPPEELMRWMDVLIAEWRAQAGEMLSKFGYDTAWLD